MHFGCPIARLKPPIICAIGFAAWRATAAPPASAQVSGRELVFLDPGWASGDPPEVTPTTMIFDRELGSAWCHIGALDAASMAKAEAALDLASASKTSLGFKLPGGGRLRCR